MTTDHFEPGQWFHGRLYARSADLSPGGDYLIYAATKHGDGSFSAWTALSKPPYLTALLMWSFGKLSQGGGLMDDDLSLRLNHHANDLELTKGIRLRKGMVISRRNPTPDGIEDEKLRRDGWIRDGDDQTAPPARKAASVYRKVSPDGGVLSMTVTPQAGSGETLRAAYRLDLPSLEDPLPFPDTGWADWERHGDLLLARGGQLFRLDRHQLSGPPPFQPRLLADFTKMKFETVKPPPSARHWPYTKP